MMSEHYISEPDKWKIIHIPFTPYFLCRDPEIRLWVLAEKELTTEWYDVFPTGNRPIYSYRLL